MKHLIWQCRYKKRADGLYQCKCGAVMCKHQWDVRGTYRKCTICNTLQCLFIDPFGEDASWITIDHIPEAMIEFEKLPATSA